MNQNQVFELRPIVPSKEEKITVKVPSNLPTILVISHNWPGGAEFLRKEHEVPYIKDKENSHSNVVAEKKRTLFASKPRIEGIDFIFDEHGDPLAEMPKGVSVSGLQLLTILRERAKNDLIRDTFVRSRQKNRPNYNRPGKYIKQNQTKVYFPRKKPDFPDQGGVKKFDIDKLPEILEKILEATYWLKIYVNHPESVVFALAGRNTNRNSTYTIECVKFQ